jgi:hypothetical protein
MLRKLLSVVLPWLLSAVVVLGACPECQPPEATDHSCCDPASQPAPVKQCPDRHEILRNFDKPHATDATVSLVAIGPAPVTSAVLVAERAPAVEVTARAEGPPDLFLRNSAFLI